MRSLTDTLEPCEAERLREASAKGAEVALADRAGATYTEYAMFQHADPTKRKLSPLRLAGEVRRF